jgi:hypothetical protein
MLLHLVHLAALANFAYALYFDIYLVKLPLSAPRHAVRSLRFSSAFSQKHKINDTVRIKLHNEITLCEAEL